MLTLTIEVGGTEMDIMVRVDQRISEVIKVLKENQKIYMRKEKIIIYSTRKREYINHRLTFQQAEIYSGDKLIIRLENVEKD